MWVHHKVLFVPPFASQRNPWISGGSHEIQIGPAAAVRTLFPLWLVVSGRFYSEKSFFIITWLAPKNQLSREAGEQLIATDHSRVHVKCRENTSYSCWELCVRYPGRGGVSHALHVDFVVVFLLLWELQSAPKASFLQANRAGATDRN